MRTLLFDTDIVSYSYDVRSPFHETVLLWAGREPASSVNLVSFVTLCELEYDAHVSGFQSSAQYPSIVHAVLDDYGVVHSSPEIAHLFGRLKADLRRKFGTRDRQVLHRYDADLLIASCALTTGAVLVSNDRMFEHLVGLHPDFRLENWTIAPGPGPI